MPNFGPVCPNTALSAAICNPGQLLQPRCSTVCCMMQNSTTHIDATGWPMISRAEKQRHIVAGAGGGARVAKRLDLGFRVQRRPSTFSQTWYQAFCSPAASRCVDQALHTPCVRCCKTRCSFSFHGSQKEWTLHQLFEKQSISLLPSSIHQLLRYHSRLASHGKHQA